MTSFIPLNQRRPMAKYDQNKSHLHRAKTPQRMDREENLLTDYKLYNHQTKSAPTTCCTQLQSSSKQFCSQLSTELNKGCDGVVTRGCTIIWGTLLSICRD